MGVQLYNNTTGASIYPITDFNSVKKDGTGTTLQTTLDNLKINVGSEFYFETPSGGSKDRLRLRIGTGLKWAVDNNSEFTLQATSTEWEFSSEHFKVESSGSVRISSDFLDRFKAEIINGISLNAVNAVNEINE